MRDRAEAPLDTIAHRGNGTVIGAFRCPPHHPRFADSGPIQNDIFVFPRTSVVIRHAGGPSFVADPTVATVYNRGQIYDRGRVSDEGDRCDWFAVPREVATEAVIANGPSSGWKRATTISPRWRWIWASRATPTSRSPSGAPSALYPRPGGVISPPQVSDSGAATRLTRMEVVPLRVLCWRRGKTHAKAHRPGRHSHGELRGRAI